MKRLIVGACALMMLAPAAASAAPRHDRKPAARHHVEKHVTIKKKTVRRSNWKRGGHLTHDRRAHAARVHNYRTRHLHAPGRGQEWVRVGNDYLLIGIASGVIASIVAAQ